MWQLMCFRHIVSSTVSPLLRIHTQPAAFPLELARKFEEYTYEFHSFCLQQFFHLHSKLHAPGGDFDHNLDQCFDQGNVNGTCVLEDAGSDVKKFDGEFEFNHV